ncbi:YheC/YheD family protein [Brevibacillus sp. SYSU BS000544]|uniref:YheC/YheD family endospore coat-associated protein n=1 Tax=Brevibacillus sp. SYSU BS000544 TaxID=3416443 RepID=UPI003CE47765
MTRPIIGILTWRKDKRFQEPVYFRRLIQAGKELGATVFLFSHQDANREKKQVRGFIPSPSGGWESRIFPWPDVVIDRCRKREPGYLPFRKQKLFVYANSTYTNKWNATKLFLQEKALKSWLPETCEYSKVKLQEMLKKYRVLYIKPGNGTGGRSILKVSRDYQGYSILGRNRNLVKKSSSFSSLESLSSFVGRWVRQEQIRDGNFMIQQGVNLELVPDRVVDTRLLIQKNSQGVWEVTGMGVRVGGANSSTSNLHGGGKALSFEDFITKRFGAERLKEIQQECHELAFQVVHSIENHFGRMMEFGLDIGIDVDGNIWLIEVNPKPGREIFKEMGRPNLYQEAIRKPIQYALSLVKASNP